MLNRTRAQEISQKLLNILRIENLSYSEADNVISWLKMILRDSTKII